MKLAFRLLILFVDYMANKNLVKLTPVHFCSDVCVCVSSKHMCLLNQNNRWIFVDIAENKQQNKIGKEIIILF